MAVFVSMWISGSNSDRSRRSGLYPGQIFT
jgi:hypothetical protein